MGLAALGALGACAASIAAVRGAGPDSVWLEPFEGWSQAWARQVENTDETGSSG